MNPKYQILAADDDLDLVTLLSKELSRAGYQVTAAYDGAEAVKHVQKKQFDLAILDIKMPKMNGLDVLKYIKKHYPATKVIILTAFADITNALEAKKNGAEAFLDKPCDVDELLALMDRLLSS
ncbi:MAG: response regulator [Ignavibacteriales bacterium]|nr:response regulator [Ignavibacteriales bacterium]